MACVLSLLLVLAIDARPRDFVKDVWETVKLDVTEEADEAHYNDSGSAGIERLAYAFDHFSWVSGDMTSRNESDINKEMCIFCDVTLPIARNLIARNQSDYFGNIAAFVCEKLKLADLTVCRQTIETYKVRSEVKCLSS